MRINGIIRDTSDPEMRQLLPNTYTGSPSSEADLTAGDLMERIEVTDMAMDYQIENGNPQSKVPPSKVPPDGRARPRTGRTTSTKAAGSNPSAHQTPLTPAGVGLYSGGPFAAGFTNAATSSTPSQSAASQTDASFQPPQMSQMQFNTPAGPLFSGLQGSVDSEQSKLPSSTAQAQSAGTTGASSLRSSLRHFTSTTASTNSFPTGATQQQAASVQNSANIPSAPTTATSNTSAPSAPIANQRVPSNFNFNSMGSTPAASTQLATGANQQPPLNFKFNSFGSTPTTSAQPAPAANQKPGPMFDLATLGLAPTMSTQPAQDTGLQFSQTPDTNFTGSTSSSPSAMKTFTQNSALCMSAGVNVPRKHDSRFSASQNRARLADPTVTAGSKRRDPAAEGSGDESNDEDEQPVPNAKRTKRC